MTEKEDEEEDLDNCEIKSSCTEVVPTGLVYISYVKSPTISIESKILSDAIFQKFAKQVVYAESTYSLRMIRQGIVQCSHFVMLLVPDFFNDPSCLLEVLLAFDHLVQIVPIILTSPPSSSFDIDNFCEKIEDLDFVKGLLACELEIKFTPERVQEVLKEIFDKKTEFLEFTVRDEVQTREVEAIFAEIDPNLVEKRGCSETVQEDFVTTPPAYHHIYEENDHLGDGVETPEEKVGENTEEDQVSVSTQGNEDQKTGSQTPSDTLPSSAGEMSSVIFDDEYQTEEFSVLQNSEVITTTTTTAATTSTQVDEEGEDEDIKSYYEPHEIRGPKTVVYKDFDERSISESSSDGALNGANDSELSLTEVKKILALLNEDVTEKNIIQQCKLKKGSVSCRIDLLAFEMYKIYPTNQKDALKIGKLIQALTDATGHEDEYCSMVDPLLKVILERDTIAGLTGFKKIVSSIKKAREYEHLSGLVLLALKSFWKGNKDFAALGCSALSDLMKKKRNRIKYSHEASDLVLTILSQPSVDRRTAEFCCKAIANIALREENLKKIEERKCPDLILSILKRFAGNHAEITAYGLIAFCNITRHQNYIISEEQLAIIMESFTKLGPRHESVGEYGGLLIANLALVEENLPNLLKARCWSNLLECLKSYSNPTFRFAGKDRRCVGFCLMALANLVNEEMEEGFAQAKGYEIVLTAFKRFWKLDDSVANFGCNVISKLSSDHSQVGTELISASSTILEILENSGMKNEHIAANCCQAIANLAASHENPLELKKCCKMMIDILDHYIDMPQQSKVKMKSVRLISEYGCVAIANLSFDCPQNQVRLSPACPTLVKIMKQVDSSTDPKIVENICSAIANLTLNHPVNQRNFAEAIPSLTKILKDFALTNPKIAEAACIAVANLALDEENQQEFTDACQYLIEILAQYGTPAFDSADSPLLIEYICLAIGNVASGNPENQKKLEKACPLLVELLKTIGMDLPNVAQKTCLAIALLSPHSELQNYFSSTDVGNLVVDALIKFKQLVAETATFAILNIAANPIARERLDRKKTCKILCQTLRMNGDNTEIVENCCMTIENLSETAGFTHQFNKLNCLEILSNVVDNVYLENTKSILEKFTK